MSASQTLLAIAGSLLLLLGAAHAAMALRDIARPAMFRPTDDAVLREMRRSDVAGMPGASLWRAWLGLNLTHSLGLLVFGGVMLGLASGQDAWLADHPRTAAGVVAVAAAYVAVAARCFFAMPAAVAGVVLACLVGAWVTA